MSSTLAPAFGLTIEEAVREAVRHPLVAMAEARVASAEGRTLQAGLRPNPLFIYQSEDFRAWSNPGHRFWQDADHFFYLQQTFETASKRARRVDVAKAVESRSAIEVRLQKQALAGRVRAAYWDAQGAATRQTLLLERLQAFDQIADYHRSLVKEGAMAEADLIRVELERDKLAQLQTSAQLEARRQVIRLARELGRDEITPFALDSPMNPDTPVPAHTVDEALAQRADAQLARQIAALSRSQVALEQALATPNVEGVGGYKRSGQFDTLLWGAQVQLPVRNRNQGNIAAAAAEVRVADTAIRSTDALVRAEFEGARVEAGQRRLLLDRLAPLRDRARENARIAEASYRLGGADLLRLLDAQRSLLEAEQLYLEALVNLYQALAQYESVTGVLP